MRILTVEEYINYRTKPVGECLMYTGHNISSTGYIRLGTNSHYYRIYGERSLHRIVWTYFNYNIPSGMVIMHTCDNKLCINPNHLSLGTIRDNVRDKHTKLRNANVNGSNNPMAKLNDKQILLIRELREEFSSSFLANFFMVSRRHIENIWSRKRWSHI